MNEETEPTAGASKTDSASNTEWVAVAEVMGATQAAVIVEYLRSQGIPAYQTGADNALSFNFGALGTAHIMVSVNDLDEARFLVKPEEGEGSSEKDTDRGPSYSGVTKTLLGASALAVNPVGTGVAIAIAYLSGRGSGDELQYGTLCPNCDTELDLNEAEIAQGWFVCPVCNETSGLGIQLSCPNCETGLVLSTEERSRGWYICPECGQKSNIDGREEDEDVQFAVQCSNCDTELLLDEAENAQGWFVCPVCNEIIDIEIHLPCPNCETELELDTEERMQGWFICPVCGQKADIH